MLYSLTIIGYVYINKMKDSYIITTFVDQFQGAASIRALNEDKVLYANSSFMTMAHQAFSFKDAMLSARSKSEYHGILFF